MQNEWRMANLVHGAPVCNSTTWELREKPFACWVSKFLLQKNALIDYPQGLDGYYKSKCQFKINRGWLHWPRGHPWTMRHLARIKKTFLHQLLLFLSPSWPLLHCTALGSTIGWGELTICAKRMANGQSSSWGTCVQFYNLGAKRKTICVLCF